jgi:hypothetical protein
MPIVFIHGVNTRRDPAYVKDEIARNALLQEILAPALGFGAPNIPIFNPYWGNEGCKFAWQLAVVPSPSAGLEAFGANDESSVNESELASMYHASGKYLVVEHAQQDLQLTIDLLYDAALAQGSDNEQTAHELARSYLRASAQAAQEPAPAWLNGAQEDNFVDQLQYNCLPSRESESFGGLSKESLIEGLQRLKGAGAKAASTAGIARGRQKINARVARFVGDCFVYLKTRGVKARPGPIVQLVLDDLEAARQGKTEKDDKLVVIAHSFGGEIIYDIVTHFSVDIEIDCLITVGSQVGLFEEMKLFVESRNSVPIDPPKGRVPRPKNLMRWLNVVDRNDIFSYLVEPVFNDCSDFEYDTGFGIAGAHGGYFLRPSFYRRLAQRLQTI